jgi:peptide/nickel transport system ATP-binding protein
MIAMAISCSPELVIADEPTTALDVTIQAQILALLQDLRQRFGMAMILISHDLGVIAEVAEEVAIMYAGRIVEYAKTEALFETPRHPYTKGLLNSLPRFEKGKPDKRLQAIVGTVPRLTDLPKGCKFAPRCQWVMDRCQREEPDLLERAPGHQSRCWLEEPPA